MGISSSVPISSKRRKQRPDNKYRYGQRLKDDLYFFAHYWSQYFAQPMMSIECIIVENAESYSAIINGLTSI